jgi:hypothetical protein
MMINCRKCLLIAEPVETVERGQQLVPWHYPIREDGNGAPGIAAIYPCDGSQAPGR